jgi:hypothetical protein
MTPAAPARSAAPALLIAIALISAAVIAFEINLMRRLLIERWHHFGYLVISIALLGFGASGPILAALRPVLNRRPGRALFAFTAALGVTLVVLPRLATLIPAQARFIPADLWQQVGWWSLYWLTAMLPFLAGALVIGAALMAAGPQVGRVYAANLIGSGLGAAASALLIARLPLHQSGWPALLAVIAALLLLPQGTRRAATRRLTTLGLIVLAAALNLAWPLHPQYDPHKYAAQITHWRRQGSAERIASRPDPHGLVELYASRLHHHLPFLAISQRPPSMYSVLVNGDFAGSILRIERAADAGVMDSTLTALPYRLLPGRPRVLLLGEVGGANAWLALRQDARAVDAVQPNAALVELLHEYTPALLGQPRVQFDVRDPRAFLADGGDGSFDLIQVAALEGMGVGSAGMRGLAEDHLATVEGFAACLAALSDEGMISICRGIQLPPRENIRLMATLTAALESLGVGAPEDHVIQVRDYLGVCTIALKSPLDDARRDALRAALHDMNLTPVWYRDVPPTDLNQPDALDGPPGSDIDWLHHAAREIFSPRRARFFDEWLLNVRATRDDSPFFWDFYKPQAIPILKHAYGNLWLTRAELGRLFLLASLRISAVAAIVLILLPLTFVEMFRRPDATEAAARTSPLATVSAVLYFAAIGLGFMGIEMALISRAIHYLGDPVIASAMVIGGVLVLSGLGSAAARRVVGRRTWLAPLLVAGLTLVMRFAGWGDSATAGLWLLAPLAAILACLMGMPMPTGLATLDERLPRLVPWAWGVNGVASVLATSLAIVIAMAAGYRVVMLAATGAYLLAAAVSFGLWITRRRAAETT